MILAAGGRVCPLARFQVTANKQPSPEPVVKPRAAVTGLEGECLRQAVHDLRGPLNTTTILADLAAALSTRDPELVGKKLSQVVQELHRLARMLDHLVATSESLAPEVVAVALGSAVAPAFDASKAGTGVTVAATALLADESLVLVCPERLTRAIASILERCHAALPEGGELQFATAPVPAAVRIAVTLTGPRVLPLTDGRSIRLTDGSQPSKDWFLARALLRGMRCDLAIEHSDAGARILIDVPRAASPTHR
jgi:hypothetical protein